MYLFTKYKVYKVYNYFYLYYSPVLSETKVFTG